MKNLIVLAIVGAALVHGYFYMSFGTFDPCRAAAYRMISQEQTGIARGAGALLSGPIENLLRSRGAAACYRTALTGELPE